MYSSGSNADTWLVALFAYRTKVLFRRSSSLSEDELTDGSVLTTVLDTVMCPFLDEMDFFEVEVWKVSPSSVSTMITLRVNFLLLLL